MSGYKVWLTPEAEEDLLRLHDFLATKDLEAGQRALEAIEAGLALLALTPYSCRRVPPFDQGLRDLLIPFGTAGYVALFEIEAPATVTVLAVRHQREDDYH
ncbi:MAG: type II toxin-antitoxin system RelE/ParE family toxin [Betaproteobacteria bacterium]|nr:type II toxin-antitoxin system RelE/ParE family toxin [Betaproteobacteria bacterium]